MSSEIKLDGFSSGSLGAGKVSDVSHPVNQDPSNQPGNVQSEDVTVTNHLNKLVSLLKTSDETGVSENSAVSAMKSRIQNNQYSIDFNALSDKLLNSGVLTTVGE